MYDPYVPCSNINVQKQYNSEVLKGKENQQRKIYIEHLENANFILNHYILKHDQCPPDASYNVTTRKDIPKQRNDWDCSVFLLVFMKYITLKKDRWRNFQMDFLEKP